MAGLPESVEILLKCENCWIFSPVTFLLLRIRSLRSRKAYYIIAVIAIKQLTFKNKVTWDKIQQFSTLPQSNFKKLVIFMQIYWYKNSKINKRNQFFAMIFDAENILLKQSLFNKEDLKLIGLTPKSISLYNLWFKNGGLTPGGGIEWFPGPQDMCSV